LHPEILGKAARSNLKELSDVDLEKISKDLGEYAAQAGECAREAAPHTQDLEQRSTGVRSFGRQKLTDAPATRRTRKARRPHE
jgi:hypothetical protein